MMNVPVRFLENARMTVVQARQALESGHRGLSIKRDQEAVEYAVKAIILRAGGVVGTTHDPANDLVRSAAAGRFPPSFIQRVPRVGLISAILARVRAYAGYGEQALDIDADAIFTTTDADLFLRYAEEAVDACTRAFSEMPPSSSEGR